MWAAGNPGPGLQPLRTSQQPVEAAADQAGSKLVEPSADGPTGPSLLLESFVVARRHPDVGRVLRERVMERQGRLTDIVEAAKANGGIDAAIDTESLVTFSHALGFGFLLIEALSLPVPSQEPWVDLIARLVDALDAGTPVRAVLAPIGGFSGRCG